MMYFTTGWAELGAPDKTLGDVAFNIRQGSWTVLGGSLLLASNLIVNLAHFRPEMVK